MTCDAPSLPSTHGLDHGRARAREPRLFAVELSRELEWLLRVSVGLLFAGRAFQHLYWDAPFAALVWNQELLEGAVRLFWGWDWQRWATSRAVVDAMQTVTRLHGVLYAGLAFVALSPVRSARMRHLQAVALFSGSLLLVALSTLYFLDARRQFGQLVEYSLQCAAPLVLGFVLRGGGMRLGGGVQILLRVAMAATFAGHGLYAAGFYELPGEFVTMTMRSLHVTEPTARGLLEVVGVLDFVVAAGVLAGVAVPLLDRPVLLYAAFWGGATALARVIAFFRWDMAWERLAQWVHETLVRLPHGLVPLFLFVALAAARSQKPPMSDRSIS